MKFLRVFQQSKSERPTAFSLIDMGRDTIKALVVLKLPHTVEPQIIGYGIADAGGHDITGGRLEANAVLDSVNKALIQAEDSTETYIGQKVVPDDVIFALGGQAAIGQIFTVRQSRPRPAEPITLKELENLRARVERLVHQHLSSLPVEGGQWQALAVTDAGLYLDGHLVLGGPGLSGQELSFAVFGVAAQASALRALEVLAQRLDLVITNIVAASQGLAAVTPHADAVVVATGHAGTDICIIRDNALMAADWIPFGGHFFTQSLAQGLDIEPARARALKHAFANGELEQTEADSIKKLLEGARQRWYNAVMVSLVELAPLTDPQGKSFDRPLPRKLFLTGQGSLLPGLDKLLRSDPAPFDSAPEVARLQPKPVVAIKDLTDGLDYDAFALALSLTIGLPA